MAINLQEQSARMLRLCSIQAWTDQFMAGLSSLF